MRVDNRGRHWYGHVAGSSAPVPAVSRTERRSEKRTSQESTTKAEPTKAASVPAINWSPHDSRVAKATAAEATAAKATDSELGVSPKRSGSLRRLCTRRGRASRLINGDECYSYSCHGETQHAYTYQTAARTKIQHYQIAQ